MNDFILTILDNGNLELTCTPDGKEWLEENLLHSCDIDLMCDMFEYYSCNGGFTFFINGQYPYPSVGLTDSPIITEFPLVEDEDSLSNDLMFDPIARNWWYPKYEAKDFCEELLNNGKVVFTKIN